MFKFKIFPLETDQVFVPGFITGFLDQFYPMRVANVLELLH